MPPKRPGSPLQRFPKVSKMMVMAHDFETQNAADGETVHQHCILLSGRCKIFERGNQDDFVSVEVTDVFGQAYPIQNWPVVSGKWKALVMLSPGRNRIEMKLHHLGNASVPCQLTLTYQPLLQLPPLHLAVLVAKDSPLLIDCPPAKRGAISTAHSTLEAAVVKFRMAAYMWQALTAEDLRQKGLGRRAFRLDEEWGIDTTTLEGLQSVPSSPSRAGTSAKVHIVRCDKTLVELRDAQCGHQNNRERRWDDLHKCFEDALRAYGAPFLSSERPVVAGLILDSHYSIEQDLVLGHAALGHHKPDGISLGVFGSHTTYAWPRFMEDIPACLTDRTPTGDSVGNDNGDCGTMHEACFVGQGAFLHSVGHAFGADHTTGIMASGYTKHWGKNFIANNESSNDAKWDLEDALKFRLHPHFLLPGDVKVSEADRDTTPEIKCILGNDGQPELEVSCQAGIAEVGLEGPDGGRAEVIHFQSTFDATTCHVKGASFDGCRFLVRFSDLEIQFDRTKPLSISILGMNGKKRICGDVWKLLADLPYIRIPGHSLVLAKQSIKSSNLNSGDDQGYHRWAVLLKRKLPNGELERANAVDLRVGCTMDGAVVHYESGTHVNCGPVSNHGRPHTFGGHASERRAIPEAADIVKVEVNAGDTGWGGLNGIRLTLDNGTRWGELNGRKNIQVLQPAGEERIVGFYGRIS
ncbi:putative peptidase family-domain-containing protein [Xylariales sp. AK1849]|nr:putative peptidase family-domain-containing protein [Xylariales sp. AK1849]